MFSITSNSLGLYEEIEKRQLHQITGGDNKKKYLIASYMSFNFLRRSQRHWPKTDVKIQNKDPAPQCLAKKVYLLSCKRRSFCCCL